MTEKNINITDNKYSIYLESECNELVTTSLKKLEALKSKLEKRLIRLELKFEENILDLDEEECDDIQKEHSLLEQDLQNVVQLLKRIK